MHVAPAVSLRVRDQGKFPFVRVPEVGAREESAAFPPPAPLYSVCWHITQGPRCPRRLFWDVLCCPGLPSIVVAWVCVPPLMVSCSVRRVVGVVAGVWCVLGGGVLKRNLFNGIH